MKPNKSLERFCEIGQALFGPSWQTALGHALDIAPRTIRRIVAGEQAIKDGIWTDLDTLCRQHAERLRELSEEQR